MARKTGSVDPSILENIKKQLEGLRRTPDGHALYSLIKRGLNRYGQPGGGIERAFVNFLFVLLGNYVSKENSDPATRLKARLVQQRLAAYLPDENVVQQPDEDEEITPGRYRSRMRMVEALTSRSRGTTGDQRQASRFKKTLRQARQTKPERPMPAETALTKPLPEGSLPEEKRNKIEQLHDLFADRVTDSLFKSKEFDGLLKANIKALQLADNPADIQDIKLLLVNGLEDLMDGYQNISDNLQATSVYLKVAQKDRALLQDEVRTARKFSRADSVTSLPKRDFLETQLEAEIGRSKRFGFSIALAMLDLDDFHMINRRYGRAAGDEVLRFYASEILIFRKYDIVARFENDEFVVIFPNTQKDGALRALEQAQKRVVGLAVNFRGDNIVLPTFTSVLTLYTPGEKPRKLLQRVVDTLTQVKERGNNQLVVSLPSS